MEFQHGAVLALAYSLGSKISNPDVVKLNEFSETVDLMIGLLESDQHALLMSGALLALGELGRCGTLPLSKDGPKSKESLFKRLLEIVKTGKLSMKIRERSALALGQLCIGDMEFPWRKDIVQGFLESARDIKDIELHFTIGEALVFATLGPLSPKARNLDLKAKKTC